MLDMDGLKEKDIEFWVVSELKSCIKRNVVYLEHQAQDIYDAIYIGTNGNKYTLTSLKIGQKENFLNMNWTSVDTILPSKFHSLSNNFFSMGMKKDYYEYLKECEIAEQDIENKLSDKERREPIFIQLRKRILEALNDLIYNLKIFDEIKEIEFTKLGFWGCLTENEIRNQYHRLAHGGAWLTSYTFIYALEQKEEANNRFDLEFNVEPNKVPSMNIHIIIGKNGVGKTTILRNFIKILENREKDDGYIYLYWMKSFSNIVFISFSPFEKVPTINGKIPFYFVGVRDGDRIKRPEDFAKDFACSLYKIVRGNKKDMWLDTMLILESDNTFVELDVRNWCSFIDTDIYMLNKDDKRISNSSYYDEDKLRKKFIERLIEKFEQLSSGHKIILLTIVKLIELVEEKTLVLIDEPEEYLHPPLISAFMRALSNLLTYRNGVGIIATHSPVIVQEVPKKCVWILRRNGEELIRERPEIETFGENLGIITSEIFGYEVTNSGFHALIQDAVQKSSNYKEALQYFNGELGKEGKLILRSLMYEKENTKEDIDD